MQIEDKNTPSREENDLPAMELDDIEEMDLSDDEGLDDLELKPTKIKNTAARKSIEQIMEERALKKQLSDVFDEDIMLD